MFSAEHMDAHCRQRSKFLMPGRWSCNRSEARRALNQALSFSQPKYLSKVMFHPWSTHFIIYFHFESHFFFCEVFFKSVQWVTKNAAAALVSLKQNKISADSWCTMQVSRKLPSPSKTVRFNSLVKSSPVITVLAGKIESAAACGADICD